MNENYYNDEVEIDLIDLMFYLLRKWKTLMLAIVVGAIVGTGLYMVKRPEPVQVPVEEEAENLQETYQVNPDVKAQMDVASRYRQLYNQQLEYSQKSLIMQMDPGAVYTGELEYYISAGMDTRLLGERLLNIMNDEGLLYELKEAADVDCEEQYLHEIISASVSYDNTSTINIDNEDVGVAKNAVVTYRIYFMDQTSCEKMLAVVQNHVEALSQEYQEVYDDYVFENVNNSVKLIINNDYLNKQKSCADSINSYLNSIKNLENSFADEDKEYYNVVYLSREYAEDTGEEAAVVMEQPVYTKELIKWLVIGILLLCVCWGIYYLVKYLMDSRVRSASELQQRYGLQILGRAEGSTVSRKGINGWLDQMERRRKGTPDTLEYISAAIDALHAEQSIMTLDQNNPVAKSLAEELTKGCQNLALGNLVHLDSATLEKAKMADGVILLVAAGQTDQKQVRRELEVCRLQKIPVLGVVVVE